MNNIRLSLLRIKAVMLKEFRQLSRDKITFGMVIMLPLIQLILFGYAINTNVRNVPIAIVDQSHSMASRQIIEDIKVTQVVTVIAQYATVIEAKQALISGHIKGVLVLPYDLTQRIAQKRTVGQWLVDGSDTSIGAALMQLKNMPLTHQLALEAKLSVNFEVALFFNPQQRSAVNVVPGLVAIILTMTMMMFTAIALVRERERGNLELLITTPVRSFEIMLAQIVPYMFIGFIQVTIVLGLGHILFAVPINGSLLQIIMGTFLFIVATLTLGLLISTIAKTQLQAIQLSIFLLLPSILLSGFAFPFEGMPKAAQWIAEILPATHFLRIIRGIVLRAATLADVWQEALYLLLFTIVGLLIASLRFKKSLD